MQDKLATQSAFFNLRALNSPRLRSRADSQLARRTLSVSGEFSGTSPGKFPSYMANGSHALRVEFINARGTDPVSAAAPSDGKSDKGPALLNSSTRCIAIWYLNNNVYVSGTYWPTLPAGRSLVAP